MLPEEVMEEVPALNVNGVSVRVTEPQEIADAPKVRPLAPPGVPRSFLIVPGVTFFPLVFRVPTRRSIPVPRKRLSCRVMVSAKTLLFIISVANSCEEDAEDADVYDAFPAPENVRLHEEFPVKVMPEFPVNEP